MMGKSRFDWECTDDYMVWYRGVVVRRLTGVKKTKQRDSRQEDSRKTILFEVVDDAIKNLSRKNKKDLLKVLQMTREFLTTGVCTGHVQAVEEEDEHEEEVQQLKKRGKTTRRR